MTAVAAVPLVVVGELGKAAGSAGDELMDYAIKDEPLEITETTVIAAPAPRQINVKAGGKSTTNL